MRTVIDILQGVWYNKAMKEGRTKPQIVPIRDLKNTNKISQMCHDSEEPIFVTKNGYGDIVMMSMETYERQMILADVDAKLAVAEEQIAAEKVRPARETARELREKYGI